MWPFHDRNNSPVVNSALYHWATPVSGMTREYLDANSTKNPAAIICYWRLVLGWLYRSKQTCEIGGGNLDWGDCFQRWGTVYLGRTIRHWDGGGFNDLWWAVLASGGGGGYIRLWGGISNQSLSYLYARWLFTAERAILAFEGFKGLRVPWLYAW